MPRILIFHASVGTGHTSAAQALGEAFLRKLPEGDVRIEDTFDYGNSLFREAYTRVYLQLSDKAPFLWKLFYESLDTSDIEEAMIASKLRGLAEMTMVTRLNKFVQNFNPDAIVCTHPLPIEVMLKIKLDGHLRAPIYCIVTDFVAHTAWINSGVDAYFLASDLTRIELIARGLPAQILHVSGIPVRLEIGEPKLPEEMRTRHNLPLDRPVITLFAGGLDSSRVRLMVTRLMERDLPGLLAIVAGRNQEVHAALADVHDSPHMQLMKLGRISYVDDLVAASDLVITKSGGLIVSEVMARGTPMIIIDPIPGQEEWNADFVVGSGAGIQLRMPETVPYAVNDLLSSPERLAMMRVEARKYGQPRAAINIAEFVLRELANGVYRR